MAQFMCFTIKSKTAQIDDIVFYPLLLLKDIRAAFLEQSAWKEKVA